MQKKIRIILILLVVLAVGLGFGLRKTKPTRVEGNLIENGDFSELTDGKPNGWETGMWVTSPGTSFLEVEEQEDGTFAALIENAGSNDARFEQTVNVRENALYRLRARVKAENCGDGIGANLSFLGIYGTSKDLHETNGEWETIELYAETGKGQQEATVAIRLGGYGSENTGKAWFTNVELEEVTEVPLGMSVISIASPEPAGDSKDAPANSKGLAIPLLIVGALAFIAASVALIGRPRMGNKRTFVLILALAAIVRFILAANVPGYGVDIGCFSAWASKMASSGPANFYEEGYFCDYPPAYMLMLGVLGKIAEGLSIGYSGMGIQVLLKTVPILADIALAVLVYWYLSREGKEKWAFVLGVILAINPAFIITSSCWGQIDSVTALLIFLFLMQAKKGEWARAIPLFALAVLTKPQAGLLAPLGIFALIKEMRSKDSLKKMGIGLLLGIAVTAIIAVPFSLKQSDPLWLVNKYISTLESYDYATLSTGNLMFLLGGNWVASSTPLVGSFTYGQIGTTLMILSLVTGIVIYMLGEGRKYLFLASAITLQLVFTLGVKMHERYILAGLLLTLLAFGETGDPRCLLAFLISSAAAAVNIGTVLAFDYLIAPNLWLGYVLGILQFTAMVLLLVTAVQLLRGKAPVAVPGISAKQETKPAVADDSAWLRRELLEDGNRIMHATRWDIAIMAALSIIYACIAFYDLGATRAPQTGYVSSAVGEQVVIDLGENHDDFHIYYYGGISDTQFSFVTSDDPAEFSELEETDAFFDRGECFKWQAVRRAIYGENGVVSGASGDMLSYSGRYIRVMFKGAGSALWEVAAVDDQGKVIPAVSAVAAGALEGRADNPETLIDEADTVPAKPTYQNSMYFDEIYHARTGYEHAHSLSTYETTHPPLGKVFMSLCIRLMGMTPFAWRFAGALTGVLMIPAIYLLALQVVRKTKFAALAAFLLTFDCMHFTQTRIATIDSFPVLFMMLMFLFMVRWVEKDFFRASLPSLLVELAVSGIFMGMAIASKWIGCYGAAGLAVMFFIRVAQLWRQWRYALEHRTENAAFANASRVFTKRMGITLGACVVFFVIVPVIIYVLSYIPYLSAYGEVKWNLRTFRRIWDAQVLMYDYHSKLEATHYFSSPWYEWPLIIKPMWYYTADFPTAGKASTIMAFGNPAVWWTGLVGILFVLAYSVRRNLMPALRIAKRREDDLDRMMPVVVIGFLSAYLPWVLVSRLTFIYHYFASVPFIIIGLSMSLAYMERHKPKLVNILLIVLCTAALVLFIAFYPLASGHEVPRAWCETMNWFEGWMWY